MVWLGAIGARGVLLLTRSKYVDRILSLLGPRQEGGGPALGSGPGNLLARLMGMPPGTEGDFVYSQAQLDRVLSQLMEQHQGNAPPPASTEAIESLPRVKVTQQMVLDGDDCAICKEELVIDEEVSQLPCKHCYHFQCVSRWLEEHDVSIRHPISLAPTKLTLPDLPHMQTSNHTRRPTTAATDTKRAAAPIKCVAV